MKIAKGIVVDIAEESIVDEGIVVGLMPACTGVVGAFMTWKLY